VGFFDAVVISEVLEHLDPDTCRRALDEIRRILRVGGRLIGSVPFAENLDEQQVICPSCATRFHRWGHQQAFSIDDVRRLLASRFEVREVFARPFIHWPTLNLAGRAMGFLKLATVRLGRHGSNESIVFVAEKPASPAAGG